MYIRRKVFSLLQDENGEERYFSTTEFEDERLYAEKEDDEKSGKGKKAAIIGGAAAAPVAVAGGYQGTKAILRSRKINKLNKEMKERGGMENMTGAEQEAWGKAAEDANKKYTNKVDKFGEKIQNAPKKAAKYIKETWQGGKAKKAAEEYKAGIESKGLKGAAKKAAEEKLAQYEKKAKRAGVRNKALMIGTPVVLTAGGVAAKKAANNRKKSED